MVRANPGRTIRRAGHVNARFKELKQGTDVPRSPLLDETAIAACMAYVDLNPMRAGMTKSLESSDFTSVQERIEDRQSAQEFTSSDAEDQRTEHGPRAGWLCPLALSPPRKRVRERTSKRRCSNKGCLPMTLDQYLQLLDWTGRQLQRGKRGRIPPECGPILERLSCHPELWLDLVRNFRKRFRQEVGRPDSIKTFQQIRRSRRPVVARL